MVVDELARRASVQSFRDKFGGHAATCQLSGQSTLLLKPMEFMNLSGFAVQRASAFHRSAAEEIIVVHDEIDLDFGRLRLKSGGGHGGHNGLRSIVDQLGSKDFLRVRVGVGKPQKGVQASSSNSRAAGNDKRVASWVLSNFPSELENEVDELVGRAADSVECIARSGIRAAMNEFNSQAKNSNNKKNRNQDERSDSDEPHNAREPS